MRVRHYPCRARSFTGRSGHFKAPFVFLPANTGFRFGNTLKKEAGPQIGGHEWELDSLRCVVRFDAACWALSLLPELLERESITRIMMQSPKGEIAFLMRCHDTIEARRDVIGLRDQTSRWGYPLESGHYAQRPLLILTTFNIGTGKPGQLMDPCFPTRDSSSADLS